MHTQFRILHVVNLRTLDMEANLNTLSGASETGLPNKPPQIKNCKYTQLDINADTGVWLLLTSKDTNHRAHRNGIHHQQQETKETMVHATG